MNNDPNVTLKNQLGLCGDQALLENFLLHQKHPNYKTQIYVLSNGKVGHMVTCFCIPETNKWYYIENAWDKEKGVHGPFDSRHDLKDYLAFLLYYKNYKETMGEVVVRTYKAYQKINSKHLYFCRWRDYVAGLDPSDKSYDKGYDDYVKAVTRFNAESRRFWGKNN